MLSINLLAACHLYIYFLHELFRPLLLPTKILLSRGNVHVKKEGFMDSGYSELEKVNWNKAILDDR